MLACESLRALRPFSREATAWLAAAGTIAGGALGAFITLVINRMGRQRLRQERELAREQHNLQLFQNLENHSLAAASILLNRLRRLVRLERKGHLDDFEQDELPAIKKVLIATLKKEQNQRGASGGSVLRKLIAEELAEALSARFPKDQRPAAHVPSPLGQGLEFQQCDIREVYWAYVNGRGLDFYGSDLSLASLRGAALEGAIFYDAVMHQTALQEAALMGANLTGADLHGANLKGANLQGAILSGANLSEATLAGAIYSTAPIGDLGPTHWPSDFTPVDARVSNEQPAD